MRLIYTFEDKPLAHQFSVFLKKENIDNFFEVVTSTDWGSSEYGTYKCPLWIIEEEQVEKAQEWLTLFNQDSKQAVFHNSDNKIVPFSDFYYSQNSEMTSTPPSGTSEKKMAKQQKMGPATLYILLACVCLFLYGELTEPFKGYLSVELPPTPLYSPPINKLLFYDYPQAFEIIDKLVQSYGIEKLQDLETLPTEGIYLLKKYFNKPYWSGFYDKMGNYLLGHKIPLVFEAPLFEKIRQGELWRLFTPAILHASFLHIFFNMLWLVFLGKIIEERVGLWRYLFLVIATGIFSNTAQYLMSGSNFVGYSGVICGMLAFVWSRQIKAPWEGYNLAPGIISFMFFFVIAMFGLQMISFLMRVYEGIDYLPSIANTAHISGGLAGFIIGRFNFMSLKN